MLAVVDYGAGNLYNLVNALRYLHLPATVTADADEIRRADGVILPGVGAFPPAMARLRERGLAPLLSSGIAGKPLLGICLGMQLLFQKSFEFGETEGLGLIPGDVVRLNPEGLKIPHMGWNNLEFTQPCPLLDGVTPGAYAYFVHSFRARTEPAYIAAFCQYGEEIPAVVQNGRVFGAQFHPEKSGKTGLHILANFARFCEPAGQPG